MTKIMEKPILSFIIIFVVTYIIGTFLSSYLAMAFEIVTPELAIHIATILTGFILAILYLYIFKIKNFLSFSNFKIAFLLSCPIAIIFLSNILDPGFRIPTTGMVLATVIISGLAPGIYEEVIFRGIVVSYLMKFFRKSKNIIPIVIVSALIFGLVHLYNAFVGAPLDMTLFQVSYAFGAGIIMAAVYLRTGNLWAPIIFHAIMDILAFCSESLNADGAIIVGFSLDLANMIVIIATIIFIIVGLYYVRPAKHDEIIAVWDEKWA